MSIQSRKSKRNWQFDLGCKDPESFEDRARILVLDVRGEEDTLRWRRGIPEFLTRRIFSYTQNLRPLASVWLDSCRGGCNKTQGECGNLRMGRPLILSSHEWLKKVLKERHTWTPLNESGVSIGKKWTYRILVGEGRGRVWRCMLVAVREQCTVHQSSQVERCSEWRQTSTTVAGKKFHMRTNTLCVNHWVSDEVCGTMPFSPSGPLSWAE